jgi:hypothetical protein
MSSKNKSQDIRLSETKFNLKLGEKIFTLNFGTTTFERIKEMRPSLPSAFHVIAEMLVYEALPLLIEAAIKPEDRDWTDRESFMDLYDACEDPAINKVLPAYLSAASAISKKVKPALEAVAAVTQNGNEAK